MRAYLFTIFCVTLSISYGNCVKSAKKTGAKSTLPLLPCGPHERRIRCKVPCDYDSCKTLHTKVNCTLPQMDAKGIKKPCESGCVCETGYLRLNGVCIPKEQCPPVKPCGENEYWDPNGTTCPQASCDYPNPEVTCVNKKSQPGCYCKKGYIRNPHKKCILPEDCQDVDAANKTKSTELTEPILLPCGPHEKRICKVACYFDDCESLYFIRDCARPIEIDGEVPCQNACVCETGYLRWNGVCIPKEQCPPAVQCTKPNEVWTDCVNRQCGPKTCDEVGFLVACPLPPHDCKGGCICVPGYVRSKSGECIPKNECSSCGGDPYAVSGCGFSKHCSSLGTKEKAIATSKLACKFNGCDCRPGYVYDANRKKCIKPEECGKLCGENEFWNPNGSSCPQASCDFPNPEPNCNDVKAQPGCYCMEGYIRNPENKCILPEDCKDYICCKGGNQTYVPCTFRCPPQNVCPTDDWPMACKPPRNCPGGCGCLPGYRWNEKDECIHASDCPEITCTKPHTYWHPCSDPDLLEDCTNRQNQEDLPPPAICKPWCICEQGYFRDSSNNCVLEADCPP